MSEIDEEKLPEINVNDPHEYAFITTTAGNRAALRYKQEDMIKAAQAFSEHGQGAFITLTDVERGDRYLFPGNIDVLHTYSHARHLEMKAEAEAAEAERRKLLLQAQRAASPLISASGPRIAPR